MMSVCVTQYGPISDVTPQPEPPCILITYIRHGEADVFVAVRNADQGGVCSLVLKRGVVSTTAEYRDVIVRHNMSCSLVG